MKPEFETLLREKLEVSTSYLIPDPTSSIMTYDVICEHDSGFLCEHRLNWIINEIKKEEERVANPEGLSRFALYWNSVKHTDSCPPRYHVYNKLYSWEKFDSLEDFIKKAVEYDLIDASNEWSKNEIKKWSETKHFNGKEWFTPAFPNSPNSIS